MTRAMRRRADRKGVSPKRAEMISMPGSELATADRRIPMEEIMEERASGLLYRNKVPDIEELFPVLYCEAVLA